MRVIVGVVLTLGTIGLMFYGCSPSDKAQQPGADVAAPAPSADAAPAPDALQAQAPQETVEQMLARWKELAASSSREKPMIDETGQVANEIAAVDPLALLSLLDLVEDANSSPFVKVLATLSLPPAINQTVVGRLIEMTKPEKDSTTRACATNLLRLIFSDEVTARLRELKADPEPRVALHAKLGIVQRDPAARQEAYELWKQPGLNVNEKGAIIDALGSSPAREDLPLMLEVATSQGSEENARVVAVRALGTIGGPEQLGMLQTMADKDPSEQLRIVAKGSADQIQARAEGKSQLVLPIQ